MEPGRLIRFDLINRDALTLAHRLAERRTGAYSRLKKHTLHRIARQRKRLLELLTSKFRPTAAQLKFASAPK
jgi:hypothetical protein